MKMHIEYLNLAAQLETAAASDANEVERAMLKKLARTFLVLSTFDVETRTHHLALETL